MCEYDFGADLLNKFSQLTPWIQAMVVGSLPASILAIGYAIRCAQGKRNETPQP